MSRIHIFVFFLIIIEVIPLSAKDFTVKPITGTWINLAYQDVRNKYTNPSSFDNTDPMLWEQKVRELADMGIEYLVFMAVANDGKAYYPSQLMPWAYSVNKMSPVDIIMNTAAKLGMKVFMSTGWAKDQDDNLRDPQIKRRQLDMMKELASLYGNHKAMYGWYLPVEDCLCPLLSDHAVEAVNALTEQARILTPEKKILISPYGIVDSDFNNPKYEQQLAKLKVDIIAYQDEIGCVREKYPLVKLKKSWEKLRDIHNRLNIELWANCETFTWENATNDRESALVPASYSRVLSQQSVASVAGVDKIISFMICGIIEKPGSIYQLGQPLWSNMVYDNYMSWKNGERNWKLLEASFVGCLNNGCIYSEVKCDESLMNLFDNQVANESRFDTRWVKFKEGYHELLVELKQFIDLREIFVRMLSDNAEHILPPIKIYLYASKDGLEYDLISIKDIIRFANSKHDSWIEGLCIDNICGKYKYLKLVFHGDRCVYIDELYLNPVLN